MAKGESSVNRGSTGPLHHTVVPLLFQFLGIDVSLNATCEESELTNDDYLKILWAAAAELPGLSTLYFYCNINVILTL